MKETTELRGVPEREMQPVFEREFSNALLEFLDILRNARRDESQNET